MSHTTQNGILSPEPPNPKLSVLLLASDLGPTGAARQLALLATGLPRARFEVAVGVCGRADTPAADDLRRAGVAVVEIGIRHNLDVSGARKLRAAVARLGPAVVHAWGEEAAWATAWLAGSRTAPRVVVSAAASPGGSVGGWVTTRRVRRADRVIAASRAEGERYHRLGVAGDRLTRIIPAVATPAAPPDRGGFLRGLGLPENARLVVTAGRLDARSGLKTAVWAFDILRYEYPNHYLLVFGDGPGRAGLEEFGLALGFDDYRVVFPGYRHDLPALLGLADVVWVTQDRGGVNLALEAMAAGRPVVAWKTADVGGVVDDGESGLLVPPGERAQVSARTHALLTDPARANVLGAAGRARAAERFGVARMVEQHARLYAEVAER